MKKLLIACVLFTGCYTSSMMTGFNSTPVSYKYSMVAPLPDSNFNYEDANIKAHFIVGQKEIDFTILNKSNSPIKIVWDDAVMAISGESNRIMHKGVKYADRSSSMPSTTILPNSSIEDLAVSTDKVYYREGYYSQYYSRAGDWETKPLFPAATLNNDKQKDLFNSVVGQEIALYLPITNGNNEKLGYTFKFKVTDAVLIKKTPVAVPVKQKTKTKQKK
ncbi:MAG: hypothetical protein JWO92_2489 [Chitinophagaceae bacterium]|nr:hypothetical protein [Chitinophagaceae bacterium]